MLISLYCHQSNTTQYIEHDELTFHVKHLDELTLLNAVKALYISHEPQHVSGYLLSLPAPHQDEFTEHTDLSPVHAPLSITDVEHAALEFVSAAELVSEPLNVFNVLRCSLKALALISRSLRDRS